MAIDAENLMAALVQHFGECAVAAAGVQHANWLIADHPSQHRLQVGPSDGTAHSADSNGAGPPGRSYATRGRALCGGGRIVGCGSGPAGPRPSKRWAGGVGTRAAGLRSGIRGADRRPGVLAAWRHTPLCRVGGTGGAYPGGTGTGAGALPPVGRTRSGCRRLARPADRPCATNRWERASTCPGAHGLVAEDSLGRLRDDPAIASRMTELAR